MELRIYQNKHISWITNQKLLWKSSLIVALSQLGQPNWMKSCQSISQILSRSIYLNLFIKESFIHHSNDILFAEPNKEKTEHNGSVPSGDRDAVVNHSPKSVGSLMSPGPGPPGSVALPGLVSHSATGVSVTVTNGSGPGRALYSPDSDPSPPTPQPPGPPGQHGHQRPVSLGTRVPGDHRATGQGKSGSGGGKKTRWLLCYHMGGGAPSASPSPPSEQGNSQCSTPSPTDHGFKLPNSFSNERPTSLPVALLNCGGGGGCSGNDSTLIPHHSSRGVVGESKLSGNCARNLSLLHAFREKFFFVTLIFNTIPIDPVCFRFHFIHFLLWTSAWPDFIHLLQ